MIEIQQSSAFLVMWPLSRRLRGMINGDFEFEFLSGIRTMPMSDNSNTAITESITRLAMNSGEHIRKFINDQMGFFTTQLRPYRHAECTLIHHLTNLKRKHVSMTFGNYVGVSKLSCLGCTKWIQSVNLCYKTRWMTAGTHEEMYPWAFFETEDEITEDSLRAMRRVHSAFQDILIDRCRIRFGPENWMSLGTSGS